MFSEVVKLVPQLDKSQLSSMFGSLNSRFASVAKKFGQGMKNALKLAPFAAIGGAILAKLLHPLQKAEEILDRVLQTGADTKDQALEIGADPGKLLRLQAVAKARGVDPESLHLLLQKFEGALSHEREVVRAPAELEKKLAAVGEDDPQRPILLAQLKQAQLAAATPGTLRNFTGETDTADAFFKFIQSLQGVDKSRQTVVQQEVFGERVRGRGEALFNTSPGQLEAILAKLPTSATLGKAVERSDELSKFQNLLAAVREANDFVDKTGLINENQLNSLDQSKKLENKADDNSLIRFDALKSTSIAIQELTDKFDKFVTDLSTNVLPEIAEGVKAISKALPSFTETKNAVNAVADPVLEHAANYVVNAQDVFDNPMGALHNDIARIENFLETTWAEFKASRIYRTFGG